MKIQSAHIAHQRPIDKSELRPTRLAAWLLCSYESHEWLVADTLDSSRTARIDFRFPLFDGTYLTEATRLYETVKEYAWWVRDPRFSRIDDSQTHATMVQNLMYAAYALSAEGIVSFAHLQPFDIDALVQKFQHGSVGALSALKRIEQYVRELAGDDPEVIKPFGGLQEFVVVAPSKGIATLNRAGLLRACNLPVRVASRPAVKELLQRIAKENGLHPADSKADRTNDSYTNKPITTQALARYLDPIEQLYAMRRHVRAEAISFKPFPLGAAKVAAVKGAETARTATPPPRLALHLLERSARIVLESDPASIQLSRDHETVAYTAAACWILIAAFSARRDDEIDSLKLDCIGGNITDGWFLRSYIGKTLQREEWIPVPSLVARAVEIMVAVSRSAREAVGSDRLFQWLNPQGQIIKLDIGRYLDGFAATVNVPPHLVHDGVPKFWHWHPHQFRRFFAILYFYRFEGASIEALSHHLRHFNIEMTRRYVTMDPEVAALWIDVEWGYMGHIARQIVSGERSVSGAAGTRLKRAAKRLTDTFRRRLLVVAPERVGAALANMMLRRGLVLTPKPWVTCSCPRTHDAARTAACRRSEEVAQDVTGPNFANAGPTVCPRCPHGCRRRSKSEPPCRPNIEPGVEASLDLTGCG
jgi:integrase